LATNISYAFHISPKPPLTTQFSRHFLSYEFDLSFHIAAIFQRRKSCVLSVVSRVNYLYIYRISSNKTLRFLKRPHSGHEKCQQAMITHKPQSTVGQKKCPIDFIKFCLILQILIIIFQ